MLDYTNIILIILFSFLALSCIITNCLICYVIVTRTANDGVFKFYIFSMAITDIWVGIISIPMYIVLRLFLIPATRQQVEVFNRIDMLIGTCSMFHISLMAFDRMMAIKKPLFHRLRMRTRKTALKLLTFPWLLATLVTVLNLVAPNGRSRAITSSVTGIGAPFIFTIICYILAIKAIRKRNGRISQNNSSSHIVNEVRLLKMVFCVLAVYLICWLPFAIVNGMILQIMSSLEYSDVLSIVYAVKFLQYFNSTCNPFVYAFFHPCYRVAVKDLLRRCVFMKSPRAHTTEMQSHYQSTTVL